MSCVTVKVPWAPQPLACMRRSGIPSRSKGAIFSISHMSCSSAGPRRPAVMMLVLSATGDPVAFVNRFSVAMISSSVVLNLLGLSRVRRHRTCWFGRSQLQWCDFRFARVAGLSAPGRFSDDTAKIDAGEVWILIRQHVGIDVTEGRLRLVLVAVVEGLDD